MGNCIKPTEPDQTSEAMLTKDLTDVIIDLTQRLNFKTREAEMYRQQANVFLQEVENKDREIALLKNELQRNKLKMRKIRFSS